MTVTDNKTIDLEVSPLGRVEGDLDLRVKINDGVVTEAWTEALMFRGFEIILRGKDPQAGLIMTPRICGICGGSHLYKACFAIDTAWKTVLPPNAITVRNIAQACETLQSIPRWFYALFAIDLVNKKYAKAKDYDEAMRRFAPFVGESYEPGVVLGAKPVEVYAIFGGQWPHSSFMIPGGVMCAPTLTDITRSIAILDYWRQEWLENRFLGCSIERYRQMQTWEQLLEWCDENESQHNSDLGFFIRYAMGIGLDKYGGGYGNYLAMGTFFEPSQYATPTVDGRNRALITRAGRLLRRHGPAVRPDARHRGRHPLVLQGHRLAAPVGGRHRADRPGRRAGRRASTRGPRRPATTCPARATYRWKWVRFARQMVAGNPEREVWQDYDPLIRDIYSKIGPSIFLRALARLHEAPKYYEMTRAVDRPDRPARPLLHQAGRARVGQGLRRHRGRPRCARRLDRAGGQQDRQLPGDHADRLEHRPEGRQGGERPDGAELHRRPVEDLHDPIELGHVARSFDSCIVCTVHAYDGKTGEEMARFKVDGMM